MSTEFPPTTTRSQPQTSNPVLEALFLGFLARHDRVNNRVIAFFNPATRRLSIFTGAGDLDLVGEAESGPLLASKGSVATMPRIAVTEEERGRECAICLEEFEVGCEAQEMPCKHHFHSGCMEKWLGMQGTCPVHRFLMPVGEQGSEKSLMNQWAVSVTLMTNNGHGPSFDPPVRSSSFCRGCSR